MARRSSEQKFIIILVPLLLMAAVVVLAYPFLSGYEPPEYHMAIGGEELPLGLITLPPGFAIETYAGSVPGARQMALSPNGTLYVGTRDEGKVYAVLDNDKNGRADEVITIASGLRMPNGVAFRDGSLYVAEINRVLRYDDIEARLRDPPAPAIVNESFPDEEAHGWKYIAFGPDGWLYVPVGAPCNVCDPPLPFASIMRMRADGSGLEVFARGVRNTVGFDWDPATGDLWFTDNGRDWMGDDLPPDELNHAPRPGMHFGFPYVHGRNVIDPEYGKGHSPPEFTAPEVELAAHAATLGMKFYNGAMFPEAYKGQIFVAEHGSWNRKTPIGYRVELITLDEGRKVVNHTIFAEGWLQGDAAWGRPVDVLVMPDGALLVSDDKAGAIYRISYGKRTDQ